MLHILTFLLYVCFLFGGQKETMTVQIWSTGKTRVIKSHSFFLAPKQKADIQQENHGMNHQIKVFLKKKKKYFFYKQTWMLTAALFMMVKSWNSNQPENGWINCCIVIQWNTTHQVNMNKSEVQVSWKTEYTDRWHRKIDLWPPTCSHLPGKHPFSQLTAQEANPL